MADNQNTDNNENQTEALFVIEDAYAIPREGEPTVYVSGELKSGTLKSGENIVVYTNEDMPVLTTTITSMDIIGRDSLPEITFDETKDNVYGLWVSNDKEEFFKEGYYIKSLANGKNKTNEERLSSERIKELLLMLKQNKDVSQFRFLSIQELCAIIQALQKNEKSKDHTITAQFLALVAQKIREAQELYLTIDLTTKTPFINNGMVDIYSVKSYAEDATDYYGKQFRKLQVLTYNKAEAKLPLFIWLTLLGVKQITLDNGQHHISLNVPALVTPNEKKSMYIAKTDAHPPFYNGHFRFAMNTALSELRWPVTYPKRRENCERKDLAMWAEFNKSHFLVAIKKDSEAENGVPGPGSPVSIPHISNDKDEFIAIFTDIDEFQKMYNVDDWGVMLLNAEQVLSIDENVGLVINPSSENLVLPKDNLAICRDTILKGESPSKYFANDKDKNQESVQEIKDEYLSKEADSENQ